MYNEFKSILRGSKCYEFDGSRLTITGYYSGKSVTLDLEAIDEEMFELLISEPDDDIWE